MYPNDLGKKTRNVNSPYAIYVNSQGWEWRVLKSWQNDSSKPFARWFCAVKSPYNYGSYDLGDCYVTEIVAHGKLVTNLAEHLAKPENIWS